MRFFEGSVTADVENNALIINGTTVHLITANSPEELIIPIFRLMML
jgi:glyceraldehyde 3-phosphate dehydrogenase